MSAGLTRLAESTASSSSFDFERISSFVFEAMFTAPRMPRTGISGSQEFLDLCHRVGGLDQLLADQGCVDLHVPQKDHVLPRRDPAFADDDLSGGDDPPQLRRRLERHLERVQVAIVDADDGRVRVERRFELPLAVDLDQRGELELLAGERDIVAQLDLVEDADDEQGGVGQHDARLVELVLVDDEVLAEDGEASGIADGAEVVDGALEELLVGEDGDGARAALAVGDRLLRRAEIRLEDALHGGRALELGDDRHRVLPPQVERLQRQRRLRLRLQLDELADLLRLPEFLPLHLDDVVEDHRSRKFRSSVLPGVVMIDSGWNCTPSTAISLWRSPMISPSLVWALIWRNLGSPSSRTTS